MPAESVESPGDRTRGGMWVGLAALALLVRWIRWARADVVDADAPRFLAIAKSAAAGDWGAVVADDFHPLYPIVIAGVQAVVDDWELAGALVSITAGVAAVGFATAFTRDAFGWPAAPVAGALVALQVRHVDFSSDVQSEGLYLAAFLASVWCGWRALSRRSARWALATGCVSGLAYLVRPEGLGIVAVVGAVAGFEIIRRRWPLARAAGWGASLLAGAMLLAAPYVVLLYQDTGVWMLSRKKSLMVVAGIDHPRGESVVLRPAPSAPLRGLKDRGVRSRSAPSGLFEALFELFRKALKAFRYEMLLLFGIGLWTVRGPPGLRGRFLLVLVAVYAAALFGLLTTSGYVSRRHWLPVLTPLFSIAALGVPLLGRRTLQLLGRRSASTLAAVAVGFVVVVAPVVDLLLDERGDRHLAERRAGEWVAASGKSGASRIVAAHRGYSAYYAQARHLPLAPSLGTLEPRRLRERGATHVVLDTEALADEDWEAVLARPGLRLLKEFAASGRRVRLLAVEADAPPEAVPGRD